MSVYKYAATASTCAARRQDMKNDILVNWGAGRAINFLNGIFEKKKNVCVQLFYLVTSSIKGKTSLFLV